MNKLLGIVAFVLAVVVASYWGWRLLARPSVASPEQLAQKAMTAPTPHERKTAALQFSQCAPATLEERRQVSQLNVEVLEQAKQNNQVEVVVPCLRVIGQQNDFRQVDRVIDLLDDPSAEVRRQAIATLNFMRLSCRPFNPDDPPEKRRAVIQEIRTNWNHLRTLNTFRTYIREKMGEDL